MNPKKILALLVKYGLATNDELKGCSEDDLEQLENHIGAKLPNVYREFLFLISQNLLTQVPA
jgi:hypothetical protein